MTKQAFKEAIKSGKVSVYGYSSTKQYEAMKQNGVKLKHDKKPLKKTIMSHIGSDWKNVVIDTYEGYITLSFDTNTTAFYKVSE